MIEIRDREQKTFFFFNTEDILASHLAPDLPRTESELAVIETREIRGGLHRDYHDLIIHLVIRFLFDRYT